MVFPVFLFSSVLKTESQIELVGTRFSVEHDTTQVSTQNFDVKTLMFPMPTRMYSMETKQEKRFLHRLHVAF